MIRFRPMLGLTLATIPAVALLIGLGVWQLQRMQWKEALLARIESGMTGTPAALDTVLAQGLSNAEWRRVSVSGEFLHDREVYLFAIDLGPGFHVITPLRMSDGETVLVDRGWIPQAARDPAQRAAGQIEGPVTVTGVIRLATPNPYAGRPDANRRLWYERNPSGMARMAGVDLAVPLIIAADDKSTVPGGPVFPGFHLNIANNHFSYALTWFGLALALMAVYLVYHHRQGRLTFSRRSG
jgi:surfeit locus 1 family protein